MIHYEPGTDGIEAFIATGTAIALALAAGATTASSVVASRANTHAVDAQVGATNKATDASTKANDEALQFQKDQAAKDAAIQETNRKADYDQWAARESRIGTLGQALGLPARQIPGYVPSQAPAGSIAGSQPSNASPSAPAANVGSDPVSAAVAKNYADLGVQPTGPGTGPTDIGYMVSKINETGGLTPDNVKYWFGPQGRIATELAKAKGGGSASTGAAPAGSILGSLQTQTGAPGYVTPAYQAPRIQPGTIRSFAA